MAKPLPWLKPGLLVGGVVPGAAIALYAWRGTLAADPVAEALHRFGLLALVFLLASLSCTPLQKLFHWTWPARIRRMLGLFAFGYASLHLCVYVGLEQAFDLLQIKDDLFKRRLVHVGFVSFLLMLPLAVTSTDRMIRRLGYVRWKRLHRLAYPAAFFGCLHFLVGVKKDLTRPAIFAGLLAVLLLWRVGAALRTRLRSSSARWSLRTR